MSAPLMALVVDRRPAPETVVATVNVQILSLALSIKVGVRARVRRQNEPSPLRCHDFMVPNARTVLRDICVRSHQVLYGLFTPHVIIYQWIRHHCGME